VLILLLLEAHPLQTLLTVLQLLHMLVAGKDVFEHAHSGHTVEGLVVGEGLQGELVHVLVFESRQTLLGHLLPYLPQRRVHSLTIKLTGGTVHVGIQVVPKMGLGTVS